jgi:hypothetical protein
MAITPRKLLAHRSNGGSEERPPVRIWPMFRSILIGFFCGVLISRSFQAARDANEALVKLEAVYELAAKGLPALPSPHLFLNSTNVVVEKTLVLEENMPTLKTKASPTLPPNQTQQQQQQQQADIPKTATVIANDATSTAAAGTVNATVTFKEFERHEGVVIVTKIHSVMHWPALTQSLCLLQQAYNNRVQYDIVVFTTISVPQKDIDELQLIVGGKLQIVVDNPGLSAMIQGFTPNQQSLLFKRCNVSSAEEMHWNVKCKEEKSTLERLSYNWQAEFRSKHIWAHPALENYKYMLWLDSDAMCTKVWDRDPVAIMMEHDLVVLFDHFPQGSTRGNDLQDRFKIAFNNTLCHVWMTNGTLVPVGVGEVCRYTGIKQIHGFFHITNLDFYRSAKVQKWADALIGESRFSRRYDDQLMVTVPAALWEGNRSWEMEYHGMKLDIFHNGDLDGKYFVYGGFKIWWRHNGTANFPEADGKCAIVNKG